MSNEDLLYWNLSCPLTFDISVYQEGGCPLGGNYHEAPLDFWTQFRTFTKGLNNIAFFNVQNQNRPLDAHDLAKGRIHSKKKSCEFSQLGILGFQGRIFLHLHKMFFGSWSNKKNWGFHNFQGGGRTEVVNIHNFFFFE